MTQKTYKITKRNIKKIYFNTVKVIFILYAGF